MSNYHKFGYYQLFAKLFLLSLWIILHLNPATAQDFVLYYNDTGRDVTDPNWYVVDEPYHLSPVPRPPNMTITQIQEDQVLVSWVAGRKAGIDTAVEKRQYIKYRQKGETEWRRFDLRHDEHDITISGLTPNTEHELQSAIAYKEDQDQLGYFEARSKILGFKTKDTGPSYGWIVALFVILILLALLILLCFLYAKKNKGANYFVERSEKAHGRSPLVPLSKGFDEYVAPADEEKRSLASSWAVDSETDSMVAMAYGGEAGRFVEDGSFIGQYTAQAVPYKWTDEKAPLSSFA